MSVDPMWFEILLCLAKKMSTKFNLQKLTKKNQEIVENNPRELHSTFHICVLSQLEHLSANG